MSDKPCQCSPARCESSGLLGFVVVLAVLWANCSALEQIESSVEEIKFKLQMQAEAELR